MFTQICSLLSGILALVVIVLVLVAVVTVVVMRNRGGSNGLDGIDSIDEDDDDDLRGRGDKSGKHHFIFSLQSGASYLSQGFKDNVLGSSPG